MNAQVAEPSPEDMYRALVLDHARNPRHFGPLENATHMADGINPLCGDKLRLFLDVDAAGRIRASRFDGAGCAISIASASMLTEAITGLSLEQAAACSQIVTTRLTARDVTENASNELDARLAPLRALDAVRDFPARVKCATLAWRALDAAIDNAATPVTTE